MGLHGIKTTLRASECGGDVDGQSPFFLIEAEKGDVAAIRRPDRRKFEVAFTGVGELTRGIGSANLRDVNVSIFALFAGPDKSYLVAIRRKGSVAFARETV